jgi:hypothetical protein
MSAMAASNGILSASSVEASTWHFQALANARFLTA